MPASVVLCVSLTVDTNRRGCDRFIARPTGPPSPSGRPAREPANCAPRPWASRPTTRCWSARGGPGSAAAPRRSCCAARCPSRSGSGCARRSRRATFPFPVKYGYLNVGVVEEGPAAAGRDDRVHPLPASVGVRRAGRRGRPSCPTPCRLAVPCWPARSRRRSTCCGMPAPRARRPRHRGRGGHDRVLRSRGWPRGIPGVEVTLVDVDPAKAPVAASCWASSSPRPSDAAADRDVVIEASGTAGGAGRRPPSWRRPMATVIVASWYGSRPVTLDLGADFHSRRLTIWSEPGRRGRLGATGAAHSGRASRARAATARGSGLRRAADRLVALDRPARRHGIPRRRVGRPASATRSTGGRS